MRAPQVPGRARLGFKPKKANTGMVEIALVPTRGPMAPIREAKPPPPRAPPPTEWFYMDLNNLQQGPTSSKGLFDLYQVGEIHDFTFVWHEMLPNWMALKDTTALQEGGTAGVGAPTATHAYC